MLVKNTLKICRICQVEQPFTSYYKHRNTKDRLRHECKDCTNVRTLKYYLNNKDNIIQKRKDYHFRKNYNLTLSQLDVLKEEQQHRCFICKSDKDLVVDHCHKTGKVRKILCNKCNQGLGSFNENVEIMNSAINYLENYK